MEDTLKLILSELREIGAGYGELQAGQARLEAGLDALHEDMKDRFESQMHVNANNGKELKKLITQVDQTTKAIYKCLDVTDAEIAEIRKLVAQ